MSSRENNSYLSDQILTYMGNKRSLLSEIEVEVEEIKNELGGRLKSLDIFSGSGVVARMLKEHSKTLYANDLEGYSKIINEAYLSNRKDFNFDSFDKYLKKINAKIKSNNLVEGIISKNYAPHDDARIKENERVFYTKRNAMIIDTVRKDIEKLPNELKSFFMSQLLIQASIHANTSGVFKGFYKDANTGIGKFGGTAANALKRIKGEISFERPVLSNFNSNVKVFNEDANILARKLKNLDLVYIDPPYNQHPYGSNYFMLNIILENKLPKDLSPVSGIPKNWKRSNYNVKGEIYKTFEDLVSNLDSKYLIVSYNSEGFLSLEEIEEILSKYGDVFIKKIKYNTFRGGRNLRERSIHVKEYIFTLKKKR